MFQDWQTVVVWLIIVSSLAYVARRGWGRLRSFRAGGKGGEAACASGCGSCGGEQGTTLTSPQKVLVQITNAKRTSPKQ